MPAIHWLKDGHRLQDAESTSLHLGEDELLSSIRLIKVQQTDMGWYWCLVSVEGIQFNSKKAFLTVEGKGVNIGKGESAMLGVY
ncbi:hypothetical protein scyTo_0020946 [Scyliorhinus torazame]|uniref:Ig-like domain-containing protein n=1 Tax=Scyliorhinus torazame TaxID=75743 RepID=A0A401PRL2_SCYTO|nr:hypothetical protein [Scyliorhinus torazame]